MTSKLWKCTFSTLMLIGVCGGAVAPSAAHAIECVQYVKQQDSQYAITYWNGKQWVLARDLFDFVYDPSKPLSNRNRGYVPTVGSIFVLERDTYSPVAGHAGIVTEIVSRDPAGNPKEFRVKHANWLKPGQIETGTFKLVTRNSVSYNGGTKTYPLRGFVYRAK